MPPERELTLEEAAGKLLTAYLSEIPLIGQERRDVLKAIPAECRFMRNSGELAYMTMIEAIMDYKRVKAMEMVDASRSE